MASSEVFLVPSGTDGDPWVPSSSERMDTSHRQQVSSSASTSPERQDTFKIDKGRRNTIQFWGRPLSESRGNDNFGQSFFDKKSSRRSSSLLSWMSLGSRRSSVKYQKMPVYKVEEHDVKRKSSLAKLKGFFSPNKRKYSDVEPGILSSPHEATEVALYNASYEQQYLNDALRFRNRNTQRDDPLDPWEESSTARQYGGACTSNYYHMLGSLEQRQLDSTITKNNSTAPVSRTRMIANSIFSTRRFGTDPEPFGTRRNLVLRSIDDIGVIPDPPIEDAANSNDNAEILHPTFVYPSPSCSIMAIHTRSAPQSANSSSQRLDLQSSVSPFTSTPDHTNSFSSSYSCTANTTTTPSTPSHPQTPDIEMTFFTDDDAHNPSNSTPNSTSTGSTATLTDSTSDTTSTRDVQFTRMRNTFIDLSMWSSLSGEGTSGWDEGFEFVQRVT